MILTSESVDEILWCDHSNETSSAVLSHGTFYIFGFYKNEIWNFSWILILGILGSERVKKPAARGPRDTLHTGTIHIIKFVTRTLTEGSYLKLINVFVIIIGLYGRDSTSSKANSLMFILKTVFKLDICSRSKSISIIKFDF